MSCGISSMRKLRKYLPTVVTRGSLVVANMGPDSFSAITPIERNLRILNSRPSLVMRV